MGSLNWASGLIPLGHLYLRPLQRHFHSLGLTNRFTPPSRSDPLVLANQLRQWQDLSFLTSGIPMRPFQVEFAIFTDASIQDPFRPHQHFGAQGGNFGPPSLGFSLLWPPSYDRYNPRDPSTGDRCSIIRLAGQCTFLPLLLLSKVIQKLRTTQERKVILIAPCQAAGFSKEFTRLAAVPKRPSTNRMYDDRWLHFAHWAAGKGIDPLGPIAAQIAPFLYYLFDTHGLSPQTSKGYRSCLASVLSRTGNAAAVQAKTISDMITSMELQRPRMIPVLPQWDLGILL